MEVYADIIFLINFIMDFFIFWSVGKIFQKNVTKLKLIFGAFLASILYCCIIFVDILRFLYNPAGVLSVLIFSVFVTFGAESLKILLKNVFEVVVVSFAVGGFATALFYFFNISDFIGNFISIYIHNFSLKFLVFSVSIFYFVLKIIVGWYKKIILKRQSFCRAEVFFNDKKVFLNALIDTGNSLYEPISGKPVIVSEFNAVKDIVPPRIRDFFCGKDKNDFAKIYDYIKDIDSAFEFRIIPFSSIGKTHGFILGFFADKVIIYYDTNICLEKVIIGICDVKLSDGNNYNALLNPEMLKETPHN